ncbi:MAG: M15 family metallopeptidase [Microthrixaceae bacterium]
MRGRLVALVVMAAVLTSIGVVLVVMRDAPLDPAPVAGTSTTGVEAITTTTGGTTTTSTAAPTSTTGAPGGESAPAFSSSTAAVSAAELGASWRAGCPVGPELLRAVDASFWGYDRAPHRGRIIVHVDQAARVTRVLEALYAARFPIERMTPIDAYDGDDQASMRANNTSGFNCRYVAGTTKWSQHAFGRAIDVNPLVNPYVRGSSVDPPEGAPYADRSRDDAGMIHAGDAAVRAFSAQGWGWGGAWSSGKDYQHFSASGR